MTRQHERLITRSVLAILGGLVLLGVVLYALRGILAPVLLAFLLAYAFNPLVDLLCRYRFPRSLASALALMLLLVVTAGLFALLVPAVQHEIQLIAKKMPAYLEKIQQSAIPWLEETLGVELPGTIDEALEAARRKLPSAAGKLAGPLVAVLGSILSSTLSLLASLVYLILIPLFIFYFLQDYYRITGWFTDLIPPSHRPRTLEILGEVDAVLSGFLRGQLTICFILAVLYSVLLSIVGVPGAITIGIVTGLFNMVPYLGIATGMVLSCLFLLLEGASWTTYLAVGAVFAGVSVAEGLFLTPRILGKKLGLAPVAVILAVLAFGEVFGFMGVLLAVPLTAIGKVLGKHGLQAYRKSRAFTGDTSQAGLPDDSRKLP